MKYLICLFFVITSFIDAKTICLNMIVKNESQVIERCLNSLKDKIDYWVIVDTGSTDGTQEIIKKCMKDIKGDLHEKPWINFGFNRDQALKLAQNKADYILFIDADEALEFGSDFNANLLTQPFYQVSMYDPKGFTTQRILLIDTKYSWQWIGAIHEGLVCDDFIVEKNQLVNGIKLINFQDGNRSCDPDKYLKDAILLENELAKYPDNTRYQFYLAQSYLNANQKILALKNYEKCYQMEGNEDERWYSLYTLARLHNDLNYPSDIITNELSLAYHLRPQRAEPLFHLAHHHFKQGNYILSYALAVQGLSLSKPDDSYFVENWIYDYGLLIVYADAANSLGLKEIALNSYEKLLKKTSLPLDAKNNIEQILLTIKK